MLEIKLETMPHGAEKAKVGSIEIEEGDKVKRGDPLIEIEADKASMTIEASAAGIVKSIEVKEGEEIEKGCLIAKIQRQKKTDRDSVSGSKKDSEKEEIETKITIIGGGPGGYVAAIKAGQMGADVTLVEKDRVGGTCLNRGCIPTKALVHSAEVYDDILQAKDYGLEVKEASVNMNKVIQRKDRVVNRLVKGIEHLLDAHNVRVIKGKGILEDENTVIVEKGTDKFKIKTQNVILATGSLPSTLPIPGHDLPGVIDSAKALKLNELPEKMIIVGGGYIGMEFAFIYKSFGVDVTVVEYLDHILANCDFEICEEINKLARRKGINILTGSRVEEISAAEDNQLIVTFSHGDNKKHVVGDKVLMSVGREPNLEGIDIDRLGLKLDKKERGLKVNKKMQTSLPNVYAIGDLTDKIQLAHVASHQGVVAVRNIMDDECEMDYSAVPSVIFTQPEIASVGYDKKEAEEKGYEVEAGSFPYQANGKALTMGARRGFVKLIKDRKTGQILGGSIIGAHASDLIAELTLAVKNKLTAEEITETIHAHPTTAEVIHEAALDLEGDSLHYLSQKNR